MSRLLRGLEHPAERRVVVQRMQRTRRILLRRERKMLRREKLLNDLVREKATKLRQRQVAVRLRHKTRLRQLRNLVPPQIVERQARYPREVQFPDRPVLQRQYRRPANQLFLAA